MTVAYVIAAPCIGVKDKSCAAVCPVECIHEGTVEVDGVTYDQLFVDGSECIDCGLCQPECPADAVFSSEDLPGKWKHFIQINNEFFKSGIRV